MELTGGWEAVRSSIQQQVGNAAYQAWFSKLEGTLENGELVLDCPDRFSRDWIHGHYGPLIERAAASLGGRRVRLRVEASEERETGVRRQGAADVVAADPPEPRHPAPMAEPSFDSFVRGPSNVLALEASRAIARGDPGRLSPLLLTGLSGVGKSHLCRAIRRERPQDSAFLSSEEFTSEVTQAIRSDRMASVRQRYRKVLNVLILEDIQFLQGKKATQVEFFHTLDHLISRNKAVVLTSDRMPHELSGLDERLRSRIGSGLVTCIAPPELDTRRSILLEKAARGGFRLPEEGLELLAQRAVDSTRDLLAGLNQVVARSTLLKRPLTVELIRETLAAVEVPQSKRSLHEIMEIAARASGVTLDDLRSRSRRRRVVRPRQLAMYLSRRYTDASLKEIGEAFDRDHTSVIYAIEQVERRSVEQPQLRYELEALAQRLSPGAAPRSVARSTPGRRPT